MMLTTFYAKANALVRSLTGEAEPRILFRKEGDRWDVTIIGRPYPNRYVGTMTGTASGMFTTPQHGAWYALEGPNNQGRRSQYWSGQGDTPVEACQKALLQLQDESPWRRGTGGDVRTIAVRGRRQAGSGAGAKKSKRGRRKIGARR